MSAMKRLWRSRGVNVESFAIPKLYEHLGIVVFGKQVCISVGKDIIRSLGRPSYICIRINSAFNSVLFKPCEEHDPMSFKVPEKLLSDHRCTLKIHSKMFVQQLLLANNLDPDQTYTFNGYYSPHYNTVIVPIQGRELLTV